MIQVQERGRGRLNYAKAKGRYLKEKRKKRNILLEELHKGLNLLLGILQLLNTSIHDRCRRAIGSLVAFCNRSTLGILIAFPLVRDGDSDRLIGRLWLSLVLRRRLERLHRGRRLMLDFDRVVGGRPSYLGHPWLRHGLSFAVR